MITFEEAAAILDEAVDALPREIFDKLNGGVNLLPATKTGSDGLLVMGMYFVDSMGRHVELYYGSFRESLGDADAETWRRELVATVKHELTHHIENLAFDRSLEKWDAQHKAELLSQIQYEPLNAKSILFVDADDAALAPMAEAFFRIAAKEDCPHIRTASAGLAQEMPERTLPNAAKAAALYEADIAGHIPRRVTREDVESHECALCMTEEQADELAEMFPEFDHRILCLGEKDITPPMLNTAGAWRRMADRIASEIDYLIDELTSKGEEI